MEKLKPLTPWQRKMANEVLARATAAGDPDPLGAVAQLMAESKMNPNAVSPAGALGLGQFMPATAKRFGLNASDPIASIDATIKYRKIIREHNAKQGLKGEEYVWSGYNAGEGVSYKARHQYKETIGYVNRINAFKPQLAQMLAIPYTPPAGGVYPPGAPSMAPNSAGEYLNIPYDDGNQARRPIKIAADDQVESPSRATTPAPLRDAVQQMWRAYMDELSGNPQA